jgi:hypothetical protein
LQKDGLTWLPENGAVVRGRHRRQKRRSVRVVLECAVDTGWRGAVDKKIGGRMAGGQRREGKDLPRVANDGVLCSQPQPRTLFRSAWQGTMPGSKIYLQLVQCLSPANVFPWCAVGDKSQEGKCLSTEQGAPSSAM